MQTDNQGFDEIYKTYKKTVLKIAFRYSQNIDIAEDVMQETFFALYKDMKIKGYTNSSDYSNLISWLYTTAKRSAINYRSKTSREFLNYDSGEEKAYEEPTRGSVEEEYIDELTEQQRVELNNYVLGGLMQKNRKWYEIIRLVYGMGVPTKEVAKSLGMSVETIYVNIHRAREWIRNTYAVEYEEISRP